MSSARIGAFIIERRKVKKLTQEELGEKLGVSSKSISRWENNITMPDLSIISTIAQELDVEVSELLNGRLMTHKELLKLRDTVDKIIKYSSYEENVRKSKLNNYMIASLICTALVIIKHIINLIGIPSNIIIETLGCVSLILSFILIIFGAYSNEKVKDFKVHDLILSKTNTNLKKNN